MSVVELLEPVLTGGIQETNYFNGRLLTAEDLRADQQASRLRLRQLAGAIGEGVVDGLEVSVSSSSTKARPVLRISPGVALNRKGEEVALASETEVALVRASSPAGEDTGLFEPCAPPAAALVNPGLYLLTIAPASGLDGTAPMLELNSEGMASKCGSRYAVEGAQFGLLGIGLTANPSPLRSKVIASAALLESQAAAGNPPADPAASATVSLIRNGAAHLMFGTEWLAARCGAPLLRPSNPTSYGLIEELRSSGLLSDCQTPIALVGWTRAGLMFVDPWSVRRVPAPRPASDPWAPYVSPRHTQECVARFLQFQAQINELVNSSLSASALAQVEATSFFHYLPPVGILPLGGAAGARGVDYLKFFNGKTTRNPVFMEGSTLEGLLGEGLSYPPIDLSQPEMIWLYAVRENVQAIDAGAAGAPISCMVFANANIPDQNNARFDVAHWSYSNYL